MRSLLPLALIALLATPLFADHGDETLGRWLAKSEVVVTGTIRDNPVGFTSELGVINYLVELDGVQWLKGQRAKDEKSLRATVVRFEMAEDDRVAWLSKGNEVILFLRRGKGSGNLITVDNWFGAQKKRTWMLRSLRRLGGTTNDTTGVVPKPAAPTAKPALRPHAAALALLLRRCAHEIEALEAKNNDWHDVTPRRFVVQRPFWPGTIDSRRSFTAEYYFGDTLMRSWSIDLGEGLVAARAKKEKK